MTPLDIQSSMSFSSTSIASSVVNMKPFVNWNKWIQGRELSNTKEVQPALERYLWRKRSSPSFTARHFSKNQNAIGPHQSYNENISLSEQKENQHLPNTSSSSTNFTTATPIELQINSNNELEKINSHLSKNSIATTQHNSKPSNHESIQIITSQTRKRQHDRYINYHSRLEDSRLYSLTVSSNDIVCYGTNCPPSVFNASYRCRTISPDSDIDIIEKLHLMNDQNIKENISYISLINLSNIIDHEPNVSRKNSLSRSKSSILMHKPSLFLADIFNKMTHEQRAKSISQLTKLHENLTKSNATIDKLQYTTSLPDVNKKLKQLHSVTSLLAERTTIDPIENENEIPSIVSTEQKHIDEDMIPEHINLETLSDKHTTNLNEMTASTFIDQKLHGSMQMSEQSDQQIISSPIKLISIPSLNSISERKQSQENIQSMHINDPSTTTSVISSSVVPFSIIKPSSSKSNTDTSSGKVKKSRSTHFLDAELDEQSSKSKFKSYKPSKIEPIISPSISIVNSTSVEQQQFDAKTKSKTISQENNTQFNQEINLENNKDLSTKSNVKQNLEELYSNKDTEQSLKAISSYNKTTDQNSHSNVLVSPITIKQKQIPSSTDKNEIEDNLNDITKHLSHQYIIKPNTDFDKSLGSPSKDFNNTNQILSLLKTTDQVSQDSNPSRSHSKELTLPSIISPSISNSKENLSMTPTKPGLTLLSPIDESDTSIVTQTITASTNLTTTDDNDDNQSKIINEQLKRSSLGLARDSLELLRNAIPHHYDSDEQLIPHTNIDNTTRKRKSVLKSHLASSDNLPTPELISYIAIDEVKGDKRLLEKQMRRRSHTVGGGIVISCSSPKPKRDSLTLLQERYSGTSTPHSGYNHLSGSDSRHVEFIRQPGDTITPALHIGRGMKSKHPWSKHMSPSSSNDYYRHHYYSSHTLDSSERSKSEMSVMSNQQRFESQIRSRHPSLDSISRHRTPQTPLILTTTTSFIDTDDIEEEKVCLNKSDYNEMVRLIMTPLSKKKKKHPIESTVDSSIEFCINSRFTTFQNLILLILLIIFYIFIFIKSQYWQEYNQN